MEFYPTRIEIRSPVRVPGRRGDAEIDWPNEGVFVQAFCEEMNAEEKATAAIDQTKIGWTVAVDYQTLVDTGLPVDQSFQIRFDDNKLRVKVKPIDTMNMHVQWIIHCEQVG